MLIKCPKCGFAQPKDQYCAQCGINMVAYRPPEKPLSKKLGESLSFQLSVIGFIAIFAIYFIMQNHKESVWSRIRFLRGSGTQIAKSNNQNQFQSSAQDLNSETQAQNAYEQNMPASVVAAQDKKAETKIYYLEVPTAILNKWLEDGVLTRVETSEGVTIAYISNFNKVLSDAGTRVKVLKEDSFNLTVNQLYTAKLEPAAATPTTTGTARAVANEPAPQPLTTYATIDEERAETYTGQLEVSVDPQTSFPVQFEMAADTSFFISGFSKAKTPDSEMVVVMKISK